MPHEREVGNRHILVEVEWFRYSADFVPDFVGVECCVLGLPSLLRHLPVGSNLTSFVLC